MNDYKMKPSELMRYQAKTIRENNCTTISAQESDLIADRLLIIENIEEEMGLDIEDIGAILRGMSGNEYILIDDDIRRYLKTRNKT